jgi:hypothetical protein
MIDNRIQPNPRLNFCHNCGNTLKPWTPTGGTPADSLYHWCSNCLWVEEKTLAVILGHIGDTWIPIPSARTIIDSAQAKGYRYQGSTTGADAYYWIRSDNLVDFVQSFCVAPEEGK